MDSNTSLKKNFILNVLLTLSTILFPLITFPYVSRVIGPAGVGKVTFATSIISYFSMFAQLGIAYAVQSQKADGQLMKCNIVLRELGGKFENQYLGAMLGELAGLRFVEGDLVVAALRFSTRDYNGSTFQDILVTEIAKV